jgi:5'-nucleotidase
MSRPQSLAVDHPDASHVSVQRVAQKLAQRMLGLCDIQAMQIQLGLDAVLAPPELAQDRTLQPRTVKHQLVAARQRRIIAAARETLLQHGVPIGAGEARARRWAPPPPRSPFGGQRFDIPHSVAEETDVVVFGVRLHATSGFSIVTRLRKGSSLAAPLLKILVSNDDGFRAEGIRALREALATLAEVTVVAPDRNRSGASNSLTLDVPLRVFEAPEPNVYFVPGTPTDCVHLAISGLFDFEHDMVVSGINDGANLGDDVLYSGTVAAAIEGRFLGLTTIAMSLCTSPESGRHFAAGAEVARRLVAQLLRKPLEPTLILNVNVPDVPFEQLRGLRTTRLGYRHRSERIVPAKDPRGRPVYWVGPAGSQQDAGPGTDFDAVANGYVSVTPLQIDLTRHAALPVVARWLEGIDG